MTVRTTTTVVNVSDDTRCFEFLPPFGVTLAPGQEYTFTGDLVDGCRRGGGHMREQLVQALEYAMDPSRSWLEVKSTPTVVLFDEEAEKSLKLVADDGKLYTQHDDNAPVLIGPAAG